MLNLAEQKKVVALPKKEVLPLRSKINAILPVALALILPGLSFYSNSGLILMEIIGLFGSWLTGSVILYILWYIFWFLWDLKSRYKELWHVIALILSIGIVFTVLFLLFLKSNDELKGHLFSRIIMVSILFLSIQYALKAQQNISRLLLEKEQMQTENYKVQLKALRAQIDPHFLFNSLNTLRSMVRQQHDNSEKFIMSLSDFYRQTLKHNENTTLPFSEELTVLQSYLFLMKSRNEAAVSININIDPSLHQFHLPAMALQGVVENCFKHNSMTSKMPLHIEVRNTEDYYIIVSNNIQPKIGNNETSGYGLNLLKKRYELMNIQHGVIVEQTAQEFTVKLKLI